MTPLLSASLRFARRTAIVLAAILGLLGWNSPAIAQHSGNGAKIAPANQVLWVGLAPGPHLVGYHSETLGPSSYHVWFPTRSPGAAIHFCDYIGVEGLAEYVELLRGTGATAPEIDKVVRSRMYATRGAPMPGAFPIVLIAQGNGNGPSDQAVLAEFLASHGFIVVTTPSPMLRRQMRSEDEIPEFAEMQALDLWRALEAARKFTGTSSQALGIVGHSFGARAALLYAMRHPSLALVSLDGGIGTATGQAAMRRAASFDSTRVLPPTLHVYETLDPQMRPDFTFLKSLRTSSLKVQETDLHHIHFTTIGYVAAVLPSVARATAATPNMTHELGTVTASVRYFLESHLR